MRIIITGAPGSGKSKVLSVLAARYPTALYAMETAEEISSMALGRDRDLITGDIDHFHSLREDRIERTAALLPGQPLIFLDRTKLNTKAYLDEEYCIPFPWQERYDACILLGLPREKAGSMEWEVEERLALLYSGAIPVDGTIGQKIAKTLTIVDCFVGETEDGGRI